ncbi:TPA: tRNA 2-selenouridine(34) synthase MnmH [Candidatus Dependentiae bacterium]|nr:MAG: tRNA 2-selenouridine(34) synthase MnmH [Lentisphaerae bacterium GWF2_44_16]HAU30565.1 tRNA 2-selenouridine(34) synthase MnmH [Candidatus Dependentiae bacterium]
MVHVAAPHQYLTELLNLPLIDVRSPAEYEHAHIPNALSIPLFSDQERAIIGTLYKQEGKEAAVRAGLEIVAPHMLSFIDQLRKYTDKKEVVVHCWRGGMRSHAVAMLFSFAGYKTYQIAGGYKAIKQELRQHATNTNYRCILIGGKTGSGKTALLEELTRQGKQVINLEQLAAHKGSAYGQLGQAAQPSQEQFNLSLFWQLYQYNPQKTIWFEHEGRRIGSLHIPQELVTHLEHSPVVYINIPRAERIERIIAEYGTFTKKELIASTHQLEQRLGNQKMQEICVAIEKDNLPIAVEKLLDHYDASYEFATQRNATNHFTQIDLPSTNLKDRAQALIDLAQRL